MDRNWVLRQLNPADGRSYREVADEIGISPVALRCMCNRGITGTDEMKKYLFATMDDLYDPMSMLGMAEAVGMLKGYLTGDEGQGPDKSKLRIAIASDYDCDGICSGVILKKGLDWLGFEATIFTPDRVNEGYGLNSRIVNEAAKAGYELIITCDNGIAANAPVSEAKELGMNVIVTDHHEPQEVLPEADVILDPKVEGETYPFSGLCGAGVAYKLIEALFKEMGNDSYTDLLPYAAIATVADVMELVDENRILVRYGLEALRNTKEAGLSAILRELRLDVRPIHASDIAFRLGPTLNATGRIGEVQDAFALLLATDESEAAKLAAHLNSLNEERKAMTDAGLKTALSTLYERYPNADEGELPDVIVIEVEGVHESLVGLIAGKIKERFNHPVIALTSGTPGDNGEPRYKGSGRSIEGYHMFNKLLLCKDLMDAFGGHEMAAGLTIKKDNLAELDRRLNADSGLKSEDFVPELIIDLAMPVSAINEDLIGELETLAPFGVANPRPLFAWKDFKVLRIMYMGETGQHLKLIVTGDENVRREAVAFSRAEEFDRYIEKKYGPAEAEKLRKGESDKTISLAYRPQINEWNGQKTIQLSIVEWA